MGGRYVRQARGVKRPRLPQRPDFPAEHGPLSKHRMDKVAVRLRNALPERDARPSQNLEGVDSKRQGSVRRIKAIDYDRLALVRDCRRELRAIGERAAVHLEWGKQ